MPRSSLCSRPAAFAYHLLADPPNLRRRQHTVAAVAHPAVERLEASALQPHKQGALRARDSRAGDLDGEERLDRQLAERRPVRADQKVRQLFADELTQFLARHTGVLACWPDLVLVHRLISSEP